jgi:hypothetical protein
MWSIPGNKNNVGGKSMMTTTLKKFHHFLACLGAKFMTRHYRREAMENLW